MRSDLLQDWERTGQPLSLLDANAPLTVKDGELHPSAEACVQLLRNRKFGDNEAGLHSRDDALFSIILDAAGESYRIQRDKISPTTTPGSRLDGNMHRAGYPPVLAFEEKPAGDLDGAKRDLSSKVFFIPHYKQLPFIVGVAISGDEVVFGTLRNGFTPVAAYDLASPGERLRLVALWRI
jgi:hypothetical protein